MYIARFKEGNLLQRRNKVYYLYKNCNDETLFYVYEKVRQKVIMSSPIFIFCYFLESFDMLFFEQKSNYISHLQYKCFALKFKFRRTASKFPIYLCKMKTQVVFFIFHFEQPSFFPL